ncbi:MAG: hypothetical protein ACK4R3_09160 [Aliihoeflea sp.]
MTDAGWFTEDRAKPGARNSFRPMFTKCGVRRMGRNVDDCAKRRLVEHDEIEFAIRFMMNRGVRPDDVPIQLARYYYVDIDEVNAILTDFDARSAPAEKQKQTTATPATKLRNVA